MTDEDLRDIAAHRLSAMLFAWKVMHRPDLIRDHNLSEAEYAEVTKFRYDVIIGENVLKDHGETLTGLKKIVAQEIESIFEIWWAANPDFIKDNYGLTEEELYALLSLKYKIIIK